MNYSTVGRPRRLTDAQIAEILTLRQPRPTLGEIARRFGVSRWLITFILSTEGKHYKRESP